MTKAHLRHETVERLMNLKSQFMNRPVDIEYAEKLGDILFNEIEYLYQKSKPEALVECEQEDGPSDGHGTDIVVSYDTMMAAKKQVYYIADPTHSRLDCMNAPDALEKLGCGTWDCGKDGLYSISTKDREILGVIPVDVKKISVIPEALANVDPDGVRIESTTIPKIYSYLDEEFYDYVGYQEAGRQFAIIVYNDNDVLNIGSVPDKLAEKIFHKYLTK